MDINKIKNELVNQKKLKFKGNISLFSDYFSYNSNKFEGSWFTSEQTEAIFDTSSFIPKSDDLIKLDDLNESKNKMINECINKFLSVKEPSREFIINLIDRIEILEDKTINIKVSFNKV